jgi:hypothetical protein
VALGRLDREHEGVYLQIVRNKFRCTKGDRMTRADDGDDCDCRECSEVEWKVVDIEAKEFSVPALDPNQWYNMPKPGDGTYGLESFASMRRTFHQDVDGADFDLEDCDDEDCECVFTGEKIEESESKSAKVDHMFKDGTWCVIRGTYTLKTITYPGACKRVELVAIDAPEEVVDHIIASDGGTRRPKTVARRPKQASRQSKKAGRG